MKYITQDWTSTKDGYLFFVQRLQEMLFHYSDDIVKAPVHNTQTLLEEYVDTEKDVVKGSIKQYQLDIIAKEIKSSLMTDVIVRELYKYEVIEEMAKFLDKVNSRDKVNSIIKDNKYNKKDSLEAYRKLLYDEFETECASSDYTLQNVNTIELLIESEDKYSQSNIVEKENAYYKKLYNKEEIINKDTEYMKLYLDDPERVIKMIKVRHGINC